MTNHINCILIGADSHKSRRKHFPILFWEKKSLVSDLFEGKWGRSWSGGASWTSELKPLEPEKRVWENLENIIYGDNDKPFRDS